MLTVKYLTKKRIGNQADEALTISEMLVDNFICL